MDTKQKYIRLEQYDMFVIFNATLQHKDFKFLGKIKSAGYCDIYNNEVTCFDKSVSLGLDSLPEDSKLCTKQLFGYEAMEAMK